MTDTAGRVAEKGADTFLAAVTQLEPGLQLAFLAITSIAVAASVALGVSVWYCARNNKEIMERFAAEVRASAESTSENAAALQQLGTTLQGVEQTLQATTLELARSQGRG